ncbi:MAG: hypothetical protein SGPRY_008052, partial [Prymnesium sp.]
VAVISPYKAQLKAISQLLPQEAARTPLLTVDRCQGQDFDCCILSLVRSNQRSDIGQLLKDWRRLNVRPPSALGAASAMVPSFFRVRFPEFECVVEGVLFDAILASLCRRLGLE